MPELCLVLLTQIQEALWLPLASWFWGAVAVFVVAFDGLQAYVPREGFTTTRRPEYVLGKCWVVCCGVARGL